MSKNKKMESFLGITYPKKDLEIFKEWLKYTDSFIKNP